MTPSPHLNARSRTNLQGVNPKLVAIVERAAAQLAERNDGLGFIVTEGVRTMARQRELFNARATRTLNGRHLTGDAVDLAATVNGAVRWDWPLYNRLCKAMKQAAQELGTPITWGGHWLEFPDGPHFELPWSLGSYAAAK